MAITSAEIQNQSFSVDRRGYDVDEVDVFLEHVADEIDELNAQIAQLEDQLDEGKFSGLDREGSDSESAASSASLKEKDDRIAELEGQLEARKADDNAIAQALIIAQRSADEIIADANASAAATVKDAEDESARILDKAEADKQKVLDSIKQLEDDRDDSREEYKGMLTEFISDATRKLSELEGEAPTSSAATSTHARSTASSESSTKAAKSAASSSASKTAAQVPINRDDSASFVSPQVTGNAAVAAPATPKPSTVEKDLSGFGDAEDDFSFDDVD